MAEFEITDETVRAFRIAERTAQGFRKKPNERVRAGLEAVAPLICEAAYRAGYGKGRDDEAEAAGDEFPPCCICYIREDPEWGEVYTRPNGQACPVHDGAPLAADFKTESLEGGE